jgi:hypothetical protein
MASHDEIQMAVLKTVRCANEFLRRCALNQRQTEQITPRTQKKQKERERTTRISLAFFCVLLRPLRDLFGLAFAAGRRCTDVVRRQRIVAGRAGRRTITKTARRFRKILLGK